MSGYRPTWLDEELDSLRELARAFCEKELAPNAERFVEQHQVDRDLWNKAGELGLLCMSVPQEYGGGGGTFAHEAVLLEEQSRVGDSAWGAGLHNCIVAHYLLSYGTEAQKKQWLPKMASGEVVGAIAMTEPGTGSDLQNVKARAVRDGDEYVINGAKTFITNGQQADLVIVVVKTDARKKASGISLMLVEADRGGFRRGQALNKIGQKGQDTSELFFEDVRVPLSNLLGTEEGQGFIQLMQQLPQERLMIAVTGVAMMEEALAQTITYTKEREAFGKPLINFQHNRFQLAELKAEVLSIKTTVDYCVQALIDGDNDPAIASMGKLIAADRAVAVVDRCVQFFGGYGYMMEYPIGRAYAAARVNKIYGGTSEIMKEIISRTL